MDAVCGPFELALQALALELFANPANLRNTNPAVRAARQLLNNATQSENDATAPKRALFEFLVASSQEAQQTTRQGVSADLLNKLQNQPRALLNTHGDGALDQAIAQAAIIMKFVHIQMNGLMSRTQLEGLYMAASFVNLDLAPRDNYDDQQTSPWGWSG